MEPAIQTIEHSRNDCTLVIMAKAPKPGLVKTRLTRNLPPRAVTALYRCLLGDTMALARSLGGVDVAIMCPGPDIEELACLAGDSVQVVTQKGEGLAAGLTSVFERFAAGRQRVVAFNSDSPHLPAAVLRIAFAALLSSDLVAGPTHDGGYYLVGASASHPGLFAGNSMGTTSARDSLLARARSLALSVTLTDPFYDIDIPEDLSRLTEELRLAPERAPRTANWLAAWSRAAADTWAGYART